MVAVDDKRIDGRKGMVLSRQLRANHHYAASSALCGEHDAAPGIPANTVKNPGAAAQPRHPASAGFRGIDKSPAQSAAGAAPLNLYYSTGGQILEERWNPDWRFRPASGFRLPWLNAASDVQYQYV